MDDQTLITCLSDDGLDQVSAGRMSCELTMALAKVYGAIGDIFSAMGRPLDAIAFNARATGLYESCAGK